MAVAVANIQSAPSDESGNSTSLLYTAAPGSDRIVVIQSGEISSVVGGATGPTLVRFGSVDFTAAIQIADTHVDSRLGLWYILGAALPVGEQLITVENPTNGDGAIIAYTLTGAAQQGPEAIASRRSGTGTSTLNVTSLTDGALITDAVSLNRAGTVTFTSGPGQTSLLGDGLSVGSSPLWMNGSHKLLATAGLTSMQHTRSGGGIRDFNHVAAAWAPSAAGGATIPAAMSLGASLGTATLPRRVLQGGIGLGLSAGVAPGGRSLLQAAFAVAQQLGLSVNTGSVVQAAFSLAFNQSEVLQVAATRAASVSLGLQLATTVAARADLQAALTFEQTAGMAATTGSFIQAALAFGLAAGTINQADLVRAAALTLDLGAGLSATARAALTANLQLGTALGFEALAQAVLEAGFTLDQVAGFTTWEGELGISLVTPEGRTRVLTAVSRQIVPLGDRTLTPDD